SLERPHHQPDHEARATQQPEIQKARAERSARWCGPTLGCRYQWSCECELTHGALHRGRCSPTILRVTGWVAGQEIARGPADDSCSAHGASDRKCPAPRVGETCPASARLGGGYLRSCDGCVMPRCRPRSRRLANAL